jgi:hypothetical protein
MCSNVHANCIILQKEERLRLTIYACYTGEIVLNVNLDGLLDNMFKCKRIREKAEEINSTKVCISNNEVSLEFSASVALVFHFPV